MIRLFNFCSRWLILLLVASGAAAQNGQRILQGYVTVKGETDPRYYRIIFTQDGTRITGYSVTSVPGYGELKATITGSINSASTEIYVRELTDVEASPFSGETCFFTARLKRAERNGKIYYSGVYDSRQSDGSPCENGIMVLIDKSPSPVPVAPPPAASASSPRPKPVRKKITPRPPVRRDSVAAPVPADTSRSAIPPARPSVPPDTAGKRPLYHWKSETLVLEVSDGWEQDGDVISVYFNDQRLLDHAKLSKQPRQFSVSLPAEGISTLRIEMYEEGNVPPNTPQLKLTDGNQNTYNLSISGRYKDVSFLYFTRQ